MNGAAHILLVEDEPLVSETVASALGEAYLVSVAETAAEAERRLTQCTFSAVLLDCLLPGGKAADVIAAADARRIPVVLMSGDPERIEALSEGGRPFLSKPFSIEQLFQALRLAAG